MIETETTALEKKYHMLKDLWVSNPVRFQLSQYDLVLEKGHFL